MVGVVRILNAASRRLRADLLHNASMASGELFHSNMLAFLLDQTRPEQGGDNHVVLESFLNFAGCPDTWPATTADLGKARATVVALQAAGNRLNAEVLEQIDDDFVAGMSPAESESLHDFVQREVNDFDALVTLNASALTQAGCQARRGRGHVAWDARTLDDLVFRADGQHFRLAVEVKVKSIATDSQIQAQWERLCAMSKDGDEKHHLLLTLYPFDAAAAHDHLTTRTFHEYILWLRRVQPLAALRGVDWIYRYLTYLKLLRLVARCTERLIRRAHHSAAPYYTLDENFQCLRRCRMYASYQKTRASFMAAQLEGMLRAGGHQIGTRVKTGDAWPVLPAFHVYSHYSNGAAGFGVVFQHALATVLEATGVQVQGQEYRTYVSRDWKEENGTLARTTVVDVEHDGVHLVEQRRNELQALVGIAGPQAVVRNYGPTWRGYGRPYGNLSPQQLLQTVLADVLLVQAALELEG